MFPTTVARAAGAEMNTNLYRTGLTLGQSRVVHVAVELVLNGVARGLVFALLGASVTLVFGLGQVLNLALGVFAVIAVIASVEVSSVVPSTVLAPVVGLVCVGVLGLAIDRAVLSRVYRAHEERRILLGIFVTLGLAIFLEGLLFVFYPLSYSLPFDIAPVTYGDVQIRGSTVVVLSVGSLVLGGLFMFLRHTYLGKASRTVFQDERGAALCGIDARRLRTLVFVLSAVIVGVAGILSSLGSNVTVASAFELTIFGIIVSIVGGVRNIRGTVAAGVLLGLVITVSNTFVGAYLSQVLLFLVAVGALVAKPEEIA